MASEVHLAEAAAALAACGEPSRGGVAAAADGADAATAAAPEADAVALLARELARGEVIDADLMTLLMTCRFSPRNR